MIQTPVIVTFANQKGGVGKTTLCVTFANYLVTKGVRLVIIDCDFQHSIMKCRKTDLLLRVLLHFHLHPWQYV